MAWLYAHRGAAKERPENTLEAFERALELGVDALEMDVRLTADGVVVVSHDPTLARTAGVSVEVHSLTLEELQGIDVGWGFTNGEGLRSYANRGVRAPTLESVLREFPEARLNVDVKQSEPPMIEPLLDLLQRERAEERVLLTSFDGAVMKAIRAEGYPGPTGMALGDVLKFMALPRWWQKARGAKAVAVQVPTHVPGLRLDSRAFIDKAHSLGLRVDYWTIDDPAEAARLLSLGADGIVSSDPAVMVHLFRKEA